ncbi:MAG: exocyst complex component exo84 [Vezdaea acicularis]|nr:MAG: exocyst complex component exo84 [Vezdaea acicularis]
MESKERSKGMSLRKKSKSKRPHISAPRAQISGPIPLAQTSTSSLNGDKKLAPDPSKLQVSGKTSDLVKRRYSARFTQIPKEFDADAPPLPSVPSLPGQYMSNGDANHSRPGTSSSGRGIAVEMNALRDPNLQPDQYVAKLLSDASPEDVNDYQYKLQKLRSRASTDLQQNVYQNRTQFIKISKEAERLKDEMRTLRSLMSDLKSNTNVLGQATSANSSLQESGFDSMSATARKQANRSSVAHLEAMWNTQLQMLWKNVEGSQKFLPSVPGRHIVRESRHWVELNTATWKPRRLMHMFLLNDHLLVASRKKKRVEQVNGQNQKQQAVPSKLVAERCWPLQDIQITDLSTSMGAANVNGAKKGPDGVTDAINICVGQESFTYRNDKEDGGEKVGLLLAFRKALEELRRSLRAGSDETGKVKDSINYFAARDPALLKRTDLVETLSDNIFKKGPSIMIDVDGKQQSLRWVENQMDELDIEIARQQFEEAVGTVENLKRLAKSLKGNSVAQDLINFKVDERAGRLASVVARRLVDTHALLRPTKTNVDWLTRLGFEDRAREEYLEARSGIIDKRTRECIFEGDLENYIFQISFVRFTLIKHTITCFQACFPPLMMSACVKWAKEHIDSFNEILARQLTSVEKVSEVHRRCIGVAKEHAALMSEVGLDFKDSVGQDVEKAHAEAGPREKDVVGLGLR